MIGNNGQFNYKRDLGPTWDMNARNNNSLMNMRKLLKQRKGIRVGKRQTLKMKKAITKVDDLLTSQYMTTMVLDEQMEYGDIDYHLFKSLHEDLQSLIEDYTKMLGPVYEPRAVKAFKLLPPEDDMAEDDMPYEGFYLIQWHGAELEDSWEPVAEWKGHPVSRVFWDMTNDSIAECSVKLLNYFDL